MYLPAPPFTRASLSGNFGFLVAPPFVTFLNALYEDCASGDTVYDRVGASLHWLLVRKQTPPQLFPIAQTGVDGGHFGYVVHAPELALADYPIGRFEPMDGGGVYPLGATTSRRLRHRPAWLLVTLAAQKHRVGYVFPRNLRRQSMKRFIEGANREQSTLF